MVRILSGMPLGRPNGIRQLPAAVLTTAPREALGWVGDPAIRPEDILTLYASTPARFARQLLADLFMLAWVGAWIWLGRFVHDAILPLRTPADSLTAAGHKVEDALHGAGDQAGRLPVVGTDLRDWLGQAARSGTSMQDAGTSMADTVQTAATVLGWLTALVPILLVGAVWLFVRGRFVARATTAQRFIDAAEDLDLFALRAMATQPMSALARVSPDPAGAWRRRDAEVIRALATLELRSHGLRPPGRPPDAAQPVRVQGRHQVDP